VRQRDAQLEKAEQQGTTRSKRSYAMQRELERLIRMLGMNRV